MEVEFWTNHIDGLINVRPELFSFFPARLHSALEWNEATGRDVVPGRHLPSLAAPDDGRRSMQRQCVSVNGRRRLEATPRDCGDDATVRSGFDKGKTLRGRCWDVSVTVGVLVLYSYRML